MKLRYLFVSSSLVLGLTSLSCSSANDDINMGSDGGSSSAGTKAQGGSATGIAGDKPYAGSSNSGGSASNAGTSSGGQTSGGLSTVGGEPSNGDAGAGSISIGGEASGGSAGAPSSTCSQDADCVMCGYPTAPANDQECYCITYCGPTAMSKADCSANQAQFDKNCANVHLPCPAIKCLPPPVPACTNHMCVAK